MRIIRLYNRISTVLLVVVKTKRGILRRSDGEREGESETERETRDLASGRADY
jgi:hypothetical protein